MGNQLLGPVMIGAHTPGVVWVAGGCAMEFQASSAEDLGTGRDPVQDIPRCAEGLRGSGMPNWWPRG